MNPNSILPLALGLVLFAFLITSSLIVPFIDILYKIKLTSKKEEGKTLFARLHSKKSGTPLGGGILVITIVGLLFLLIFPLITYAGVFIHSSFNLRNELLVIFFTFISFGLLGLIDDLIKTFGKPDRNALGVVFGLSKKQKFALQCVLALVTGGMLHYLLGIDFIHLPILNQNIYLGPLYIPFAASIIIFFTNAFNFTDGLDGLAGGLLMIYLFAYVIIATGSLDTPLFVFIALWLGSLIAFLYFNVWPARVWMGDAGALSFGAMIAVIGLLIGNVATLFVIGGLFVLEAASSLLQMLWIRFFKKKLFPLAPVHHSFLAIGWEEPKIVTRAWLAAIMLAVFGLWLAAI